MERDTRSSEGSSIKCKKTINHAPHKGRSDKVLLVENIATCCCSGVTNNVGSRVSSNDSSFNSRSGDNGQ